MMERESNHDDVIALFHVTFEALLLDYYSKGYNIIDIVDPMKRKSSTTGKEIIMRGRRGTSKRAA